jgi:hypothetical protein|nr:hypothetical protein [Neorhizobium tomejilense]
MNDRIDFDSLPEEDLARWALANGWEAEHTMLFDEEGVEGWRWTKGSAEGFCVTDGDIPNVGTPASMYVVADLLSIDDLITPDHEELKASPLAPSPRIGNR